VKIAGRWRRLPSEGDQLDDLWRECIRIRDNLTCQRCFKPEMQAHHVITRGNPRTRWVIENGLGLCEGCHKFWWHMNPGMALDWFKELWPERWAIISLKSRVLHKTDKKDSLFVLAIRHRELLLLPPVQGRRVQP
jgi:5-methylcytosine-specific restriction endonuclease McrA